MVARDGHGVIGLARRDNGEPRLAVDVRLQPPADLLVAEFGKRIECKCRRAAAVAGWSAPASAAGDVLGRAITVDRVPLTRGSAGIALGLQDQTLEAAVGERAIGGIIGADDLGALAAELDKDIGPRSALGDHSGFKGAGVNSQEGDLLTQPRASRGAVDHATKAALPQVVEAGKAMSQRQGSFKADPRDQRYAAPNLAAHLVYPGSNKQWTTYGTPKIRSISLVTAVMDRSYSFRLPPDSTTRSVCHCMKSGMYQSNDTNLDGISPVPGVSMLAIILKARL